MIWLVHSPRSTRAMNGDYSIRPWTFNHEPGNQGTIVSSRMNNMLSSQMDEFPSHIHLSVCLVPISNYWQPISDFGRKWNLDRHKNDLKKRFLSQKYSTCFIRPGLCRMGIMVIVILTMSESFRIIIRHRSNFDLESFSVVCLAAFQCFILFSLYLVVNLSNELEFHYNFAYQIKNVKKINVTKWHIVKLTKFYVHKKNLIIVMDSVKQHGAQIIKKLYICGLRN
jgi:hypothetical protein